MRRFPERLAWLNRHIGDRADTAYLAFNRVWLQVMGVRVVASLAAGFSALLIYVGNPFVGALCLIWGVGIAFCYGRRRLGSSIAQGAVLDVLRKLPRGNTLFNELEVPGPEGSVVPVSVLLVTQKGFHVFECKHNEGHVSGSVSDARWTIDKRGHAYSIENPVSQVRRQVFALSRQASAASARGRITGVVVFTHPSTTLAITGRLEGVWVVHLRDLFALLPTADPTGASRRVGFALGIRRGERFIESSASPHERPVLPSVAAPSERAGPGQ